MFGVIHVFCPAAGPEVKVQLLKRSPSNSLEASVAGSFTKMKELTVTAQVTYWRSPEVHMYQVRVIPEGASHQAAKLVSINSQIKTNHACYKNDLPCAHLKF